jgi:hypothetical protein
MCIYDFKTFPLNYKTQSLKKGTEGGRRQEGKDSDKGTNQGDNGVEKTAGED